MGLLLAMIGCGSLEVLGAMISSVAVKKDWVTPTRTPTLTLTLMGNPDPDPHPDPNPNLNADINRNPNRNPNSNQLPDVWATLELSLCPTLPLVPTPSQVPLPLPPPLARRAGRPGRHGPLPHRAGRLLRTRPAGACRGA